MDEILILLICLSIITCIILPSKIIMSEQESTLAVIIIFTGCWLALIYIALKIALRHRKPI